MLIRDLGTQVSTKAPGSSEARGRLAAWQRAGQRAVDRLRARFDLPHLSVLTRLRGGFVPNVDLVESDRDIRLQVDLPGVDEQDVEAAVCGASLTLRGVRRGGAQDEAKDTDLVRHERRTGPFERIVMLPCAVTASAAEARFVHGVLDLRFPKVIASPASAATPRSAVHAA